MEIPDILAYPTLIDGMAARRSVRFPGTGFNEEPFDDELRVQELFDRLTEVALANSGVTLYLPVTKDQIEHEEVTKPAAVTVVGSTDVRRNAALLGEIDRQTAYRALRVGVPSFNSRIVGARVPDKGSCWLKGSYHNRILLLRFGNASQLGHERYGMKSVLAGLAGVPADELSWKDNMPQFRVAEFTKEAPQGTPGKMIGIIREYTPFDLNLLAGRLFPSLGDELPNQPVQPV